MRLLALLLVMCALTAGAFSGVAAVAPAQSEAAARSLSYAKAKQAATRLAARRARRDSRIVGWELVRGFKLMRHKWVFAWYADLADGRGCTAQLVTRYASQTSRKVVAYFRIEECS